MTKIALLPEPQYGRLIIIDKPYLKYCTTRTGKANYDKHVLAVCECGEIKEYKVSNLKNNHTVSCGCYRKETSTVNNTIHGYTYHPLYNVWCKMKDRCYNENDPGYHRYGGRGISVCSKWLNNPKAFVEFGLANGWKLGLEIDRTNNNGNYEPKNCRFVIRAENIRNSSSAKLNYTKVSIIKILYKKDGLSLSQIAIIFEVTKSAISAVVNNKTWVTKGRNEREFERV